MVVVNLKQNIEDRKEDNETFLKGSRIQVGKVSTRSRVRESGETLTGEKENTLGDKV